jgi:hypothetical protein
MRSNGSVAGNRVYILVRQNARVEFRAYPYLSAAIWCSAPTSACFRAHS